MFRLPLFYRCSSYGYSFSQLGLNSSIKFRDFQLFHIQLVANLDCSSTDLSVLFFFHQQSLQRCFTRTSPTKIVQLSLRSLAQANTHRALCHSSPLYSKPKPQSKMVKIPSNTLEPLHTRPLQSFKIIEDLTMALHQDIQRQYQNCKVMYGDTEFLDQAIRSSMNEMQDTVRARCLHISSACQQG